MSGVTIIIFGASGSLARKKLIPALYGLYKERKLTNFIIVGCASTDISADELLKDVAVHDRDSGTWNDFAHHFYYQGGVNFIQEDSLCRFNAYVCELEREHNLGVNRLVYLAVASDYFCDLTNLLASTGCVQRSSRTDQGWTRLVYEKPFGKDMASARRINECIRQHFDEHQIYRIDHYLTKELVANIALLRFTNTVFEPLWNNRYVQQVEIILEEQEVVTGRAEYYDHYGALRDVVQNHVMELIALIAMESPEKLEGEYIRDKRVDVLKKLCVVDGIVGQYSGYQTEPGVRANSSTETWAALYCMIDNPRWQSVPFLVRTGKGLCEKKTTITVVFKAPDCLLVQGCPPLTNTLTIRIDPDAGFSLSVNTKKPGIEHDVMPAVLDFCQSCLYQKVMQSPYQVVLEDVLRGITSVGVRFDEIEYAWHVVDAIKAATLPLYPYPVGGSGPVELEEFNKKHGIRWVS